MAYAYIKPNVLPDPRPSPPVLPLPSAPPPAYRTFAVPSFVPRGGFAGQITIEGQIVDAQNHPVVGSSYDATLYLLVNGLWQQVGRPVANIAGGQGQSAPLGSGRGVKSARLISFMYGGIIDVDTIGFLQITNIVPAGGVQMLFSIHDPQPAGEPPRSLSGAPEVSLAAPANWKTLPAFASVGLLGQLIAVPTPVEQYVLLQADPGNAPGSVEILSQGATPGSGFVLEPGLSVQWPTRDASSIYISTPFGAGSIVIATRF